MNPFIKISEISQQTMLPGFQARFIHSNSMTVSFWDVTKGSKLPEHKHPHEQISQVMEGKFQLTVNGNTQIMEPGKIAVIPSNALHSGEALTDCKVMDIFSPVREDYKLQ